MASIDFNQEVETRVIPQIGSQYKTKDFAIEIIDKKPSENFRAEQLVVRVTSSSNRNRKAGEVFDVEEIAFYSNYYQFVK
jgi:hypothetical protein